MVTVKQFLDAGFGFVLGDKTDKKDGDWHSKPTDTVKELAWRKNTGVQPVGDDCWVEIEWYNGTRMSRMASDFLWGDKITGYGFIVKQWKPSLKHLERKMNDTQEIKTALEMSERDIENCNQHEWENGDSVVFDMDCSGMFVGYLPKNKDMCVVYQEEFNRIYSIKVSELSKPETPEQKAARERDEEIKSLMKKWGHVDCDMNRGNIVYAVVEQMLEAGYRKQ